jgi:hypothetical protein
MQNSGFAVANEVRLVSPTNIVEKDTDSSFFASDTTFVLFFLAMDFGQAWLTFGIDGLLAAVTLIAFVVLPYFLPTSEERPEFSRWIFGRFILAAFGITIGLVLKQAVGVLLPEWLRFMPMTLLIVSAIFSLYFQLYATLRVRLAR